MSSNINKPTGLGYAGTPWRECDCGHSEQQHFGHRCYALDLMACKCKGFAARDREADEAVHHEWTQVDEVLYRELKDEVKRRGN